MGFTMLLGATDNLVDRLKIVSKISGWYRKTVLHILSLSSNETTL